MDGCHLEGRLLYPLQAIYSICRCQNNPGRGNMPNKIDLTGRNAVVTGGAQGIGKAIVERFLESGAAVAIWDRDAGLAKKAAAELQKRGRLATVAIDVTDYSDVERARDET